MMSDFTPRKRRRPAKACEQCRYRKVRCDLNVPCGPCTRAKTPLACSYRDGEPDPDRICRAPTIESRPRDNAGCLPSPTSLSGSTPNDGVHQAIRDIKSRLGTLEKRVSSPQPAQSPILQEEFRTLTTRVEKIENELPSSNAVPEKDSAVGLLPPRLRSSVQKVKFMGPTHWCNKMDQLAIAKMLSKPDPDPSLADLRNQTVSTIKECRELRHSIKAKRLGKLSDPVPDLRSTIPSKKECDELVHCYLRTFEPIYRITHVPSFWSEYEEFWRQPESISSPFLIKLVLILAIGTVYRPLKETTGDAYHQLVQKWTYAAQWWLTGPSEKSTSNLDGLQTMCLLLIARQACGLGPSPWLSAASLMRAAVAMGLHRNPSNFPPLSKLEAELRLRLWATVRELGILESLGSATPVLLPTSIDAGAPNNIDDKDLSSDTASVSRSGPSDRLTDTSMQVLLHKSLEVRTQVLNVVHNTQGQSYQAALDLGTKLRAVCRKAAAFFYTANSRSTSDSNLDLRLTDFHAGFIDIHLHQCILALYAPFMVQARKDPRYYYARKASLDSARAIASYAERQTLPDGALDDLSRLFMSGKGTFKGPLTLDVISVLGLEIVTQLEEESETGCLPGFDSLDRLADANRNDLIRTLEHILSRLFHLIADGTPSMKRYGLLAAKLGQIRAMKDGEDVKRAVYDSVAQSFRECFKVLQPGVISQGDRAAVERLPDECENEIPPAPDMWDTTLLEGSMAGDLDGSLYDMDFQGLFTSGFDGNMLSLFG